MPRKGSIAEVAEGYEAISAADVYSWLIKMSSETFQFNLSEIKKIKELIRNKFRIIVESKDEKQNIILKLILSNNKDSLNLIFYGTGKCLLQGKEGDFFEKISSFLKNSINLTFIKRRDKAKAIEIDESKLYELKECIIGFDEAGKGECIGPMVFGSVLLPKDKLLLFKDLKRDIKTLSLKELNYYCSLLREYKIKYYYEIISSLEITNFPFNLNRLMDNKYINLIRKYSNVVNQNFLLVIDNYNIRDKLQKYLENLKKNKIEFICKSKMDENVTAVKLASIVARQIRLSKMEELNRLNTLYDNKKSISFGKGASNDITGKWLRVFRKSHPSLEFPDFVRKKWSNVKEIEQRYPKKQIELKFLCPNCKEEISKILIYYNPQKKKINYHCSKCNKIIEKDCLRKKFTHIICDTNAYVAGILSKDFNSEKPIFEGCCVIQPFKILDEIETIRLSQKRGAQKELEKLKMFQQSGKIKITTKDYEITDPFDADKKLYDMISKNNGCVLISGDYNVADISHANGAFVFKIINYDPEKNKKQ
ncbi:MAG: hypothetical protein JSW08_02455 [archaeon]|nr:MAG: hypothetical protein JSW08_02455 [archaeon]